jgi:uncharacterized protein (TIGR02117 family)
MFLSSGCASPGPDFYPPGPDEPVRIVFLVQRGWHTGIAVPKAAIGPSLWPEQADFTDGDYLEVGWGDGDFYPAEAPGVSMALAAAFWSRHSVLNVERIPGTVPKRYPCSRVLELRVPPERFERLIRFIHDYFDRAGANRAAPLAGRQQGQSRFYPARDGFHLFNNCNTWVLRALRAAGYSVTPTLAVTSDDVLRRTRRLGRLIEPKATCS